MDNFEFYRRTRIKFGRNSENEVGQLIKYSSGRRVLIITGQHSAQKTGLIEKIKRSLDRAGLEFKELSGLQSNPLIDKVRQGIKLCRDHSVDFVLAVGGGSVIDTGKAIAAGVFYEGDVWEIFIKRRNLYRALPIGVVLTNPGSGSECSTNAVLSEIEDGVRHKVDVSYDCFAPAFAILNPELTFSLDLRLTALGCADMFTQVLEYYFTNTSGVDLSDRLAEGMMQSIIKQSMELARDLNSYDARANLMWASTMAHHDFLGSGRQRDGASHKLEYQLSALYDTPHGAGLAVIVPAWMTYVTHHNVMRMAQFGHRVMGVPMNFHQPLETAKAGIAQLRLYFKRIGLPQNFAALGVRSADIERLLNNLSYDEEGTIGSYVKLNRSACEAIYYLAATYSEQN